MSAGRATVAELGLPRGSVKHQMLLMNHSRELLAALKLVLATREREAAAWLSLENAKSNFSDPAPESSAYAKAAAAASQAERNARELIAKVESA